jgi:hypothetical protein
MKSGYQLAQQDKKDKNTGLASYMNNEGANKYGEKRQGLRPFNAGIKVCNECGKVDVYLNDGHMCDRDFQNYRRESNDQ